ncbi:hypothetical protein P154DRAFT_561384 [Amniculicola lignicola CBS 123094]|uniref:N-acetylglucosamine-induced protein 1 n=1 Tax=Amniculicola lignicola CBS 123094 TaxID=1392246 RepID=A0A6A5WST1_9PLEO|nr:hypothetical protein P154DRAFT_561384 [Amniculicola lignicola CBS 123094]
MAPPTQDHPSHFRQIWKSHPDPTTLPFPKDNPPFNLTTVDWAQLNLTDSQYSPHSWENLRHLIGSGQLDELKRWPSDLKAYLAWSMHVKTQYGSATEYLLRERLGWVSLPAENVLKFDIKSTIPFEHEEDYRILGNDWPYGLAEGITHIVVWLKSPLDADGEGALTESGRSAVEGFVRREFRERVGEKDGEEGAMVMWFKNTKNLQSVRGLEHVHVLVRGLGEEVLGRWMK